MKKNMFLSGLFLISVLVQISYSRVSEQDNVAVRLGALERKLQEQNIIIEKQTDRINLLEKEKHERSRRQVSSRIGFTAYLSVDQTLIGINQVIKFDHVLYNEGNAYNMYTGTFTAPVSGTYLLMFNFMHFNSGKTWLRLMINGNDIVSGGAEGSSSYQDLQGGNQIVNHLDQGDAVFVENYVSSNADLRGRLLGTSPTTFSCALLYEDE